MKLCSSVKIGNVQGIDIKIHTTLIFLFLLINACAIPNLIFGIEVLQSLKDIFSLPLIFFFVLVHELGHSLAGSRFGIPTTEINLYPFGGVAYIDLNEETKPKSELIIAIAGPATNIIWALLFLSAHFIIPIGKSTALSLAGLNLFICVFNLIPAHPMDGGRILKSLVSLRKDKNKSDKKSQLFVRYVALIISLGFIGVGFSSKVFSLTIIGPILFFLNLYEIIYYNKLKENREIERIKEKIKKDHPEILDIIIVREKGRAKKVEVLVAEGTHDAK